VTYTGDVRVGGPSDTREIGGGLTVTKLAVGDMNNNAYLLRDASGQGLLIDAAAEPDRLIELIGDTPVTKIVTTHQHGDHWQALAAVKAATGAITVAHPADAPGIPVETDELVEDGGTVTFGDTELSVIHLVGHTPGSIALVIDADGDAPHIFTGDCLFPGGPGRTTRPEDFNSLMGGLEERVFKRLPDETWIYPGHGNDSTLGAERPHLQEWRARGW
jgi:glyoxylase-like metal-dependent hydrolase (beta-lactamase superfamily II)